MKKNTILYILLVFLIVVNGFFLFNYMSDGASEKPKGPRGPGNFIAKELGFDDTQLKQFRKVNQVHHQAMMRLSDDIKDLKDELFEKLNSTSENYAEIDSISILIGEKVQARELKTFYHFKKVRAICNAKQKEKFKAIIKDALRRGGEKGERPPRRNGEDGHRPPPRTAE